MRIKTEAINTLRCLSCDMIDEAGSGHPGMALSAAPIIYSVYSKMNYNLLNDKFFNRDRFVLSAGHASSLLYATLSQFTNAYSNDDLKKFRKMGSKTPGHPEVGSPFVDCSTGLLGQGVANAVGMAIAEARLSARFNKKDLSIINHYTYALVSDGDLMEGVSDEALSIAGNLRLKKLILLYDANGMTIEGGTNLSMLANLKAKYKAMGFNVITVFGGNSDFMISWAIERAKKSKKPSIIICKTQIGYGSQRAGKAEAHGSPLGETLTSIMKQNFGLPTDKFHVSDEVKAHFDEIKHEKNKFVENQNELLNKYEKKYPADYAELKRFLNNDFNFNVKFKDEYVTPMATRDAGGKVLNKIADKVHNVFGGSADLAPSTRQFIVGGGDFLYNAYAGKNIHFGVREHAMGAICNGIALHGGFKVYCSTFLGFASYMLPAIRMSAQMNLPVLYVFTADSIALGEDGPTHQPVEQLVSLRAIPNVNVFRPADFKETEGAYEYAFQTKNKPSVIVLTRQKVPCVNETITENVSKGAYVVKKSKEKKSDYLIIASGSELALALDVALELEKKGKSYQVVSMVCTELFDKQDDKYKESVLPEACRNRIIIEAGSRLGLMPYATEQTKFVSVDEFGDSAPGQDLLEKFGFTVSKILNEKKSN